LGTFFDLLMPGGLQIMRKFSRLAATAVAVAALGTTAAAQGRGAGKAPTTKAPNVGTSAPKGGGATAHGASSTKAGAAGTSASTKTTGAAHGGSKKTTTTASTGTSSGSSTSTTTASTGTTAAPTTFEPNAISTKISKNPGQLAKVNAMLLTTGMSIEEASAGFRNHGQFMAALNVSKNQNIDFVLLKEAMTIDGLSLGQAAKQIRTAPPAPETTETEAGSTTSVSVSASNGSTTVSGSATTGTTTAQTAK